MIKQDTTLLVPKVRQCLQGLTAAMAVDGFKLRVEQVSHSDMTLEILPESQACEACLIDPDIFSQIVRLQLPKDLAHLAVRVIYLEPRRYDA